MPIVNAAQSSVKNVGDPNASYESLKPIWNKSRAVCSGERYVKEFDEIVDTISFTNLLLPFSPTMTANQYKFYKSEAELPGIVAEFSKMLVGGLLRKKPLLQLPEGLEEAYEWILNEFSKDNNSLVSFLDEAIWEEIQTSRCWVFVDYPKIPNPDSISLEEKALYKPYPVIQKAESIINWRTSEDKFGKQVLSMVIVRGFEESFEKNEFHPTFKDTVWVHDLDTNGFYRIRKFQRADEATQIPVVAGQQVLKPSENRLVFNLIETNENILNNGERLDFIPAWPLNGSIEAQEPFLSSLIDKEVSLYNKVSRRNHLLYGAATYTPVVKADITDDEFEAIVESGLGTWIKLGQSDSIDVLKTPTDALADMEKAIAAGIEEMAKLGIRMLSPESAQSGVALEIRNAAQTAKIGTLNTKISATMAQIISFMIGWRYNIVVKSSDIKFSLAQDFNPVPADANWLRLITEWYQGGLIPRSVWLLLLKQNDVLPPDYDDTTGQVEITNDNLINLDRKANLAFAEGVIAQQLEGNLSDGQVIQPV
jgi:hypothetical protein